MKLRPIRPARPQLSRPNVAALLRCAVDGLVLELQRDELEQLAMDQGTSLVALAFLSNVADNLGRLRTMVRRRRAERARESAS